MVFHLSFPQPSSPVSLKKMAACAPGVVLRELNGPCSQGTVFSFFLRLLGELRQGALPLFHLTQKSLRVAKRLHTKGVSPKTLKVNEHAAAA